jgi:transposase-like protein
MNIDLTDAKFHDEDKAREWLELSRWPNGVICCHCGSVRPARMGGKSGRPGLFHCPDCRGQFTVRTGQVMERSHIPLTKWVLGFHLMASSKKGVSALQLQRTLDVAYNTAWFMAHRIREAMADTSPAPIGGKGKTVEADEMYHGKKELPTPSPNRHGRPFTKSGKSGGAQKRAVVALVERGGEARAVAMTAKRVNSKNVREVLVKHADRKSRLHTDESVLYPSIGGEFAKHETVNHAKKEYARGKGDALVTTNSVEGFFGVFKRGFNGVYQHCGEQHFQRYLDEFTFRYNHRVKLGCHDGERAQIALASGEGKRLTWRRINAA